MGNPGISKYAKYLLLLMLICSAVYFYLTGERKISLGGSHLRIMNTLFRLNILGYPNENSLPDEMAAELRALDQKLSRFIPASEISEINRNAGRSPVPVSIETFSVIETALMISELTAGAFDITVGSLVDAWRITPLAEGGGEREWEPPAPSTIDQARALTGHGKVILDHERNSVLLPPAGMSLDLGGIAKGYALDIVADRLHSHGVSSFLAELGGNIFAGGRNRKGQPWKIGILHPRRPTDIIAWIEVTDASVSTSGDYENYRTFRGERFNHIIDPRTGMTAKTLVSVTIISPSATLADALSTAAFVLGPEEGLKLIENRPDADGIFIDSDIKITVTSRLQGKLHLK